MFTGGAMENCAMGALGIMPYISSTIVMQLLTAVVPSLSKMAREEGGRVKIIKYSRYLTVLICLGQGFLMALGWEHPQSIPGFERFPGDELVLYQKHLVVPVPDGADPDDGHAAADVAGRADHGAGHRERGFAGHHHRHSGAAAAGGARGCWTCSRGESGSMFGNMAVLVVLLIVVVAGVIAVTQAQRKIPVQYAQRAVGRKIFSGGTSFLPLRLNFAGVMPIIFAQAILMVPQHDFALGWQPSLELELALDGHLAGAFVRRASCSISRFTR